MKILLKTKKCLILVNIQLSENFMMIQTKQFLIKRKMKQLVFQLKNFLDWSEKHISFCCNNKSSINDKIFIQNKGYDGLLLAYQS